jgi:hypothetical protein
VHVAAGPLSVLQFFSLQLEKKNKQENRKHKVEFEIESRIKIIIKTSSRD